MRQKVSANEPTEEEKVGETKRLRFEVSPYSPAQNVYILKETYITFQNLPLYMLGKQSKWLSCEEFFLSDKLSNENFDCIQIEILSR